MDAGKRYATQPDGSEEPAGIDRGDGRQPLGKAGTQVRLHGCRLPARGRRDDGGCTCSMVGLSAPRESVCHERHRTHETMLASSTAVTTTTDADAIAASLTAPHAFAAVFERHFDAIHRFLRGRVGATLAEELASETFVRARARVRYDRAVPDARPWLFAIATNLVRGQRRAEVRRLSAYARLDPAEPHGADEEAAAGRADAAVRGPALARALCTAPRATSRACAMRVRSATSSAAAGWRSTCASAASAAPRLRPRHLPDPRRAGRAHQAHAAPRRRTGLRHGLPDRARAGRRQGRHSVAVGGFRPPIAASGDVRERGFALPSPQAATFPTRPGTAAPPARAGGRPGRC
ncbi:MAG: hypothetical protein QOH83_776 [Solirubrobacteraceae bacterium]|nr:hypothetical protein [Solirubrobacteraceae bacterium]